ncbi:MAG: gluconate permease [Saprospiraceae bacterium]|nr:gluconate permease [Saprospiraceae bacterium]
MALIFSIAFLLVLILVVRLNAFIALILTSLFAGFAGSMPPLDILKSIQNGLGSTLGGLVLVLALGIMLGSILSETGAIQIIASKLLTKLGHKRAGIALMCTGFVVGLALFYNAGFVVLAPLVFAVAAQSGAPLPPLAIAMAAPLSVTHGFLPPHPGATAVANAFGADLGKTLILGLIAAIPAILLAGVLFPKTLKTIQAVPPSGLSTDQPSSFKKLPGTSKSMLIALLPVLLMAISSFATFLLPAEDTTLHWYKFIGDPGVALLIAVLSALLFLGNNRLFPDQLLPTTTLLLEKSAQALGAASILLLVTAAGGAFKQVLIDSGLGAMVAKQFEGVQASPLLLGWGIATLLRISIGSATIAGMTASGIALPIMQQTGASPELMTLAVGAGSLMCSHVNDTGFWMFKEWFGLSLRDTFKSWTVMETIVGLSGLGAVLILDLFV